MKKLLYNISIVTALTIISFDAFTQTVSNKSFTKEIDSLKKVLQNGKEDTIKINAMNLLGQYYQDQNDYADALEILDSASRLSEKVKDTVALAMSFYNMAKTYSMQDNSGDALKFFYKALELYEQLKSKRNIRDCLLDIGNKNNQDGKYAETFGNYSQALKISKELADTENIAYSYLLIANLAQVQGKNDEALKNYNTLLEIRKEQGSKWGICQSYINIGNIYLAQRNYSEALKMDSIALSISREIKDNNFKWTVAMSSSAIGGVYETNADFIDSAGNKLEAKQLYAKALKNYIVALQIWQSTGSKFIIANMQEGVGEIYTKLKDFNKAKYYFETALNVFKQEEDKSGIKDIYQSMASLDSATGNFKAAYEHHKLYISYRDSIDNAENTKKSIQSKIQYEFDKKESMAKEQQDKKDEKTKRIRDTQYLVIASLGILVLAVLMIAFIQLRNSKQRKKANKVLENTLSNLKSTQAQLIQSEKMASLGELTAGIAHEIQNPLNFVNNFSDVNTELIEELKSEWAKVNSEKASGLTEELLNDIKENEEKINHHGKRADAIVKGMLQHSQSGKGQKALTDINALADEYLRLSYKGFRAKGNSFNVTMKTDFDKTIGKINIIPQDIGRVLLNLYNNAFYAASPPSKGGISDSDKSYDPTVWLSTKKVGDKVLISVRDNGSGIPQNIVDKIFQPFFTTKPTGQGTGLGLSLSYDIVKAHDGEIKVKTNEGEGTEFIVEIPVNRN